MTEHTVTTREELPTLLADTCERGWAMDDQEVAEGLRCHAVALPLSTPPIGAASVAVPHLPDHRRARAVDPSVAAAVQQARR